MNNLMHKIAIIEDSKLIGNIIGWKLSQNPNYQVRVFLTGEDFCNQQEFKPDLVVLDYQLNGKVAYASDGLQLMKYLQDIPVIVISAQQNLQVAIDFIRKGVCDYVIKDSNMLNSISTSIKEVLRHKESKKHIAELEQRKKIDLGRIGLLLIGFILIGLSYRLLG